MVEKDATLNNTKIIASGMFKLDLEPLSPKEIVEHAKAPRPLASDLDSVLENQQDELQVVQIVLWYLDSGCSKHMTRNNSQLINFVHKFLGIVIFGNDQIAKIIGYGDLSDGKCYDFSGLVRGLPRLKFQKDHLCFACALGKSKKHFHKPKDEDSIQEKLYLLHMDLYGPTKIQSINGRKYILVIVDDYSRFKVTDSAKSQSKWSKGQTRTENGVRVKRGPKVF
ncbi:retrovirus-related pol polyprotein from transposon TNT 1-94 [Tanacetum coccineum]